MYTHFFEFQLIPYRYSVKLEPDYFDEEEDDDDDYIERRKSSKSRKSG